MSRRDEEVVFDLDGVLLDSEQVCDEVVARLDANEALNRR
jgi:beta-phosphoglucomutase-like phosphatase (HAD superfamily)